MVTKKSTETRSLEDWQRADAAHYLHPFTDSKALAAKGTRVIVRGEGIYIWDATGHKLLDGMSGLVVRQRRLWPAVN